MEPGSQFSSGSLAHRASKTQFSRAQLLSQGLVTQEPAQLRHISPWSLSNSVLKSLTAQLRPCSPGASSGRLAVGAPVTQFSRPQSLDSGRVAQEPGQLRQGNTSKTIRGKSEEIKNWVFIKYQSQKWHYVYPGFKAQG